MKQSLFSTKIKQVNKKGFTLIELMVAIAIVAILATIGIAFFTNSQKTAMDGKRKSDVNALSQALENKYDAVTQLYSFPATTDFAGSTVPIDPVNTAGATPPGTAFQYYYTYGGAATATPPAAAATAATFIICAHMENVGSGNADDQAGTIGAGSDDWYCRKSQQN